jgi:hypothetical protein
MPNLWDSGSTNFSQPQTFTKLTEIKGFTAILKEVTTINSHGTKNIIIASITLQENTKIFAKQFYSR